MRRATRHVLAAALAVWGAATAAQEGARSGQPAINAPFLFINQEQILVGSGAGKALLAEEEEKRRQLVSEARAIDAAFEDEERALTEKRGTISTEDFRKLANAFDQRVVAARQKQDERSDQLAAELEQVRRRFYATVAPILVDLMDRFGAVAIFDENSVLLADQRLNITAEVIAQIDAGRASGPDDSQRPTEEQENGEDQP
jgi:Skp family chaperone for outer membrane proteins